MERDVVLLGCPTYDRDLVDDRIRRAFALLGGPEALFEEGSSVFLKVNAFIPAPPDKGATTHPEVVRAVVRQVQSVTRKVTIGDSPGGPYSGVVLKRLYRATGLAAVAQETGASLNFDTSVVQKKVPGAKTMKSVTLCGAMVNADSLVSISKFKTHMLMNITGAVKNLFGAVPGMNKFTYHSRFKRPEQFAEMLVDVVLAARPRLNVVDAVVGMDGNGPRRGDVRRFGFIAAGMDAFTVDAALMRLSGHPPSVNLALDAAIKRGIVSGDAGGLDLIGDDPASLAVEAFRLPDKKDASSRIPGPLHDRFADAVSLRPFPDPARCTGCRKCEEICPEKAMSVVRGVARVDLDRCIRCYCCHELCEYDAIDLERPFLLRMISRGGRSRS